MRITLQRIRAAFGLRFARIRLNVDVPRHIVESQDTAGRAFTLACTAAGLDDKEIYRPLGIDQGYFSKIKNDKATLQENLVPRFCAIVGNTIYTDWRNHHLQVRLPQEQAMIAVERLHEHQRRTMPIPEEMVRLA